MGRQTTAKSESRRRPSPTKAAEAAATKPAAGKRAPTSGRAADSQRAPAAGKPAGGKTSAGKPAGGKTSAGKPAGGKTSARGKTAAAAKKPAAGTQSASTAKASAGSRSAKTSIGAKATTRSKTTAGTKATARSKATTGAKATAHSKATTGSKDSAGQRREIPGKEVLGAIRREFGRISAHPLTTYYLILAAVLLLTSLGLVMVLSASSITSYDGGAGSSFAYFNKQAGFAAIGIVLMFVAAFVPLSVWEKLAWPAILLGVVMQALVFLPGLGKTTKGNANWIQLGAFQLQPSEFLKIALAVWLGFILAKKYGKMTTFGHAMIPIVPVILLGVGLVVGGNDLGTGLVLMAMALVCLFIGFFPWRYFLLLLASGVAVATFFVFSSQNRLNRITSALTGHADQTASDITGQAWQSNHGLFSLASGGWLGVGLGASREKWSWLPEAHNDFIFAIIGEELGLLGSLAVVLVFAILAYGMIRVILRSKTLFIQVATAGLFAWLIGQAAINIGVVTGLLPVIGLPLPFVSYGGSSIIASLLAIGVVLSFARTEEGADAAIKAHKDRLRSSFAVLARKRKK